MNTDGIVSAKRAIETLAKRDGVSPEEILNFMRDAILEAQKNLTPQAELLWKSMTPDGSLPSPEELIIWIASVLGHGSIA